MTRRTLAKAALMGLGAGWSVLAAPDDAPASDKSQKPDPVTGQVADFILNTRFEDLPPEVLELAKKSILDSCGVALAGSAAKTGEIIRSYIQSLGVPSAGPNTATLIGSSLKAPVRFAALANAVSMHGDDYDDTQLAVAEDRVYGLLTHPSAPAFPSSLAYAETKGMSGRELMLAYNLGVEVECKIAEAIAPRHYEEGFHSTGTCGVFGSATAVSKLRGLDRTRLLFALGIAASRAGGLRENFGTMSKPLQAGQAAETGVVAADLAALGWNAADQILEAPRGFFQAAGGGFDRNAIVGKLGKPWTFVSPGVSIKPFPSGSLSHPGMTEMSSLIREYHITGDQVASVDVGTNRNMPNALIHHQPTDSLQAKFSMEFCMAALLLYGKAGLLEFTDEVVNRPAVQDMIRKVHFGVNPIAEAAGYNKMTTIIDIHLKDGRTISGRADFGKGSPANPMSYDEVAAKFTDCAMFVKWPPAKAKAIVDMVRHLEEIPNVTSLTALCAKA
jgi:2-methylcitrate dehydratase PrpD